MSLPYLATKIPTMGHRVQATHIMAPWISLTIFIVKAGVVCKMAPFEELPTVLPDAERKFAFATPKLPSSCMPTDALALFKSPEGGDAPAA